MVEVSNLSARQWVSSDGDIVYAMQRPAKNFEPLSMQLPAEWGDESVLLATVKDRLEMPVFVECTWEDGRWKRTDRPVLTRWDIKAYLEELKSNAARKGEEAMVFDVGVNNDGHIVEEERLL